MINQYKIPILLPMFTPDNNALEVVHAPIDDAIDTILQSFLRGTQDVAAQLMTKRGWDKSIEDGLALYTDLRKATRKAYGKPLPKELYPNPSTIRSLIQGVEEQMIERGGQHLQINIDVPPCPLCGGELSLYDTDDDIEFGDVLMSFTCYHCEGQTTPYWGTDVTVATYG